MHHHNHSSVSSLPAIATAVTARPAAPFAAQLDVCESPTLSSLLERVAELSPARAARTLARFAQEHGATTTAIGAALIVDGVPFDCWRTEETVAELGQLLGY